MRKKLTSTLTLLNNSILDYFTRNTDASLNWRCNKNHMELAKIPSSKCATVTSCSTHHVQVPIKIVDDFGLRDKICINPSTPEKLARKKKAVSPDWNEVKSNWIEMESSYLLKSFYLSSDQTLFRFTCTFQRMHFKSTSFKSAFV